MCACDMNSQTVEFLDKSTLRNGERRYVLLAENMLTSIYTHLY